MPDEYFIQQNIIIIKERKFLSIIKFLPNLEIEHTIGINNIEVTAKPTWLTFLFWVIGREVGDIYLMKEGNMIFHLKAVDNFREFKAYLDAVKSID